MIDEEFAHIVLDHVEKEYPNPLRIKEKKAFFLGSHFAYGFFIPVIEDFAKNNKFCNHPGCCCVCGHQKQCPEDGPSLVSNITD